MHEIECKLQEQISLSIYSIVHIQCKWIVNFVKPIKICLALIRFTTLLSFTPGGSETGTFWFTWIL